MSILNDDSSSSDDDEMLKALQEATDSQFLRESLFHRKYETEDNVKDKKIALPKSLRRNIEFVEEANEFGVTQDFKNFVAKQLAKSLDKTVKEIDVKNDSESKLKKRKKKRDNTLTGIKLMSDSKVDLKDIEVIKEDNIEHNTRRRKELKNNGDNHVESISKCREVAVQPDWILSKSSTTVWAERQKGTVYKYKKSKDGGLIEMD